MSTSFTPAAHGAPGIKVPKRDTFNSSRNALVVRVGKNSHEVESLWVPARPGRGILGLIGDRVQIGD